MDVSETVEVGACCMSGISSGGCGSGWLGWDIFLYNTSYIEKNELERMEVGLRTEDFVIKWKEMLVLFAFHLIWDQIDYTALCCWEADDGG